MSDAFTVKLHRNIKRIVITKSSAMVSAQTIESKGEPPAPALLENPTKPKRQSVSVFIFWKKPPSAPSIAVAMVWRRASPVSDKPADSRF